MTVTSGEAQDVATYLDQIKAQDFASSETARIHVLAAAQRLVVRLQRPIEQMGDINFAPPVVVGAMQTCAALGLWEAWAKGGGGEKSLDELVAMANTTVEKGLLRRICRVLTGYRIFEEVGEDRFTATKMSLYLGDKEQFPDEQLRAFSDHWRYGGPSLSEYLKEINYKEPQDNQNTAFKLGNPERAEFWARVKGNPTFQASFGGAMEGWSRSKTPWPEFYDTHGLLTGADLEKPLLVDVGGNVGNDISRFLKKHPDVPSGSLVLQDRPEPIEAAAVDGKIKKMSHDFLTPQPILGSRAYFLHAVLHDWPDEEAIQIMQHLSKAMTKGYSKLLICDIAVPATKASGVQAVMDVAMMSLLGARERTRQDWHRLLTKSGFRIVKWWDDPYKFESVIEAELE